MFINGNKIPDLLIELVNQGKWTKPLELNNLLELTKFQNVDELFFLDFKNMEMETNALKELIISNQREYGLTSVLYDNYKDMNRIGLLDIDKSITIAIDYRENTVSLDYRLNREKPSVFVSELGNFEEYKCRYIKIANSFEEFVNEIGIPR